MKRLLYIPLITLILASCTHQSQEINETHSELIEITKQQFQSEKMVLGHCTQMPFATTTYFTGYIKPKSNALANIGLPVEGIIQKIYVSVGQEVKQGAPLFEVSGNTFVDLQKEYAESEARLKQLQIDYERVNLLYKENIGTQKEYVIAQSQYQAERAMNNALKIKLENIGLDIQRISDGSFYSGYTLNAPINGYVTDISAAIGEFIDFQESLAQIVDNKQLQLQITVFEKDILSIKSGQEVVFHAAGNPDQKATASINYVGKTVRNDSKSIDCYATIDNAYTGLFINNQFIEGEITTASDSVFALPVNAILQSDNSNFILSLEEETSESYLFKMLTVKTGRKTRDYVEIMDKPITSKILLKGVYNIAVE